MLGDQSLRSGFGVRSLAQERYDPLFAEFANRAESAAFTVANLETVIVERVDGTAPSNAASCAPRSALKSLHRAGFRFLSLANNHSMEFGPSAFWETARHCEEAGIEVFGTRPRPYQIACVGEHRIGILGFSTIPAFYGCRPEYVFAGDPDLGEADELLAIVRKAARETDFLIVCPHWGAEFVTHPSRLQIVLARELIHAGADLIAGAHAHIIQDACTIDGRAVFFGLGNLVTDYWQERLRRSIVLEVDITQRCTGRVHEFMVDIPAKLCRVREAMPFAAWFHEGIEIPDDAVFAKEVNRERRKVRVEIAKFLLRHSAKVATNVRLIAWIVKRCLFILRSSQQVGRDPTSVYGGPVH